MATYKELQAQIEALKHQAEAQRKAELAAVVADIRAKMDEFGITLTDLGTRRGASSAKGSTVAPKYRHPQTNETWTGRGKMPRWLQNAVDGGKRKEDFLI
ncbi:DNA binding protein, nucleoid-associated [mine drainage metagenome]|jgi:DNA-binding protein H-NS|uniref:DNA binding protein, nucleoid-associated n=1 Tax=mine drainage metagenome TaxID=410659 RepID=A0A1J5PJI8_9ZZZZ